MFKLIWKICTFQAKPEEVPYSIPLLLGKIIVNLCVLVFIITIATSSIQVALERSALFLLIIITFVFSLLKLRGYPERTVQVLSGLLASMAMILVPLGIPYVIIQFFLSDVMSNIWYFIGLVFSSGLLILASSWMYVVFARIFRHALEITINQGLLLSLGFFSLSSLVFMVYQP